MSRKCIIGILLLCACSAPKPALPDTVAVRIFARHRITELELSGASLKLTRISAQGALLRVEDAAVRNVSSITLGEGITHVRARSDAWLAARVYAGTISLTAGDGEIIIINHTPFETWVHNAAVAELGGLIHAAHESPAERELVMAQEIAIRSFAVAERNRHDGPYQFCDLTHCSVYQGIISGTDSLSMGRVLMRGKKVIPAYFHSTCGGGTVLPSLLWKDASDTGFHKVNDACDGKTACRRSPHHRWHSFITWAEIASALGVPGVTALQHDTGSRHANLRITTPSGTRHVTMTSFMSSIGRSLGWNRVKSPHFSIESTPRGVTLRGQGLGHGVGMCQYGALARARAGWDHSEILEYYYDASVR